jgi:hypothetical protein
MNPNCSFLRFGVLLCVFFSSLPAASIPASEATTPAPKIRSSSEQVTTVSAVNAFPALFESDGKLFQAVRITIQHSGDAMKATARVSGAAPTELTVQSGAHDYEAPVPAVDQATTATVTIEAPGRILATKAVTLKPVRNLTVYILPHSHTDIGFTEIQTRIEEKQVNNLLEGIQYARETAQYPAGARFVWNVEVLWAADLYLHRLSPSQRTEFFNAVRSGQVALNGMYLNELTGLCRPEELIRLFQYSTKLSEQCGVPVDSAMISDVPGYTWGTVTAMAHAGIKYFSVAPNYFDRIGDILVQWENKPFYWVSPSGKEKVLVWIPFRGYALSHIIHKMTPQFVLELQEQLDKTAYPYDIAYLRWSGHGDNAVPDPVICDFVKDWNAKYRWPRFIISSTSEAFRAFEQRFGEKIPQVRGDWTPYWEDGAGSSADETAMNRLSSDRLVQAETLWAMLNPATYPAAAFEEAWRNVLLYSEHTWGADCAISEPASPKTKEQWEIKKSFATQANLQSRELIVHALENRTTRGESEATSRSIDVFNTASWPRTELVTLVPQISEAGDRVVDDQGRPVPSQRLANHSLAFVARDVPPFAGRRYRISGGAGGGVLADGKASANGAILENGLVRVRVDERTGGIVELRAAGIDANLADAASSHTLNDYLYLIGDNPADVQRNGPVKISVREKGPLVASLLVESDAPGCHKLSREVRVVAGLDYVELINTVDKKRLEAKSYHAKDGKESLNFAFPFNVPDGEMLLDLPFGAIRPELDQMPSACKNWLTIGRWADVSNRDFGVTWVTLDAPLVQVGGLTATLLNSQTDPKIWRHEIERTQKIYSWAMNNHWGTNYRAYQEGPTVFRFILHPHRRSDPANAARSNPADATGFNAADATRFATAFSQPLIAAPARGAAPRSTPLLRVDSPAVLVSALKPSDDGKALIVRLFAASGQDAKANLSWSQSDPQRRGPTVREGSKQLWLSDTSEKPLKKIDGAIDVPAWGVVTLRVETAP